MPQNTQETFADKLRREYLEKITKEQSVPELSKDLTALERIAISYRGREILELIQNMNDQGNHKKIYGLIKIQGSNLIVCNQGTPFSEQGIISIHAPDLSPKDNDSIGNKGLGFRGLLNFADKIQIFSGKFNLEFSQDFADKEFAKIKDLPQIKKSAEHRGDRGVYLSMLSTPVGIDCPLKRTPNGKFNIDGCEYDTVIKVHVKDDKYIEDIKEQIKKFIKTDCISLFFLWSLDSMTFIYDDVVQVCSVKQTTCPKIIDNPNITKWELSRPSIDQNDAIQTTNYYLCQREDMAICIPEKIDLDANQDFFCFFPIQKEASGFPIFLHAKNFDLGSDRNTFENSSKQNSQTIHNLIDFMLETATCFATPEFGTMSMDMLHHMPFSEKNPFYEYRDYFYDQLYKCPIIPTIKSLYKSLSDGLKLYPEQFKDCAAAFSDVDNVITTEIHDKIPTILQNKLENLDTEEVYNAINQTSKQFDADTRARLFYDWKKFHPSADLMPKILKNTNGDFFTYNSSDHDKIHLTTTDMEIFDIPTWANSAIVAIPDKNALHANISKIGSFVAPQEIQKKDRYIANTFKSDFISDDITDVLPPINNKINNEYDRAVDFVVFLIKNIKNSVNWNNEGNIFMFPSANGTVVPADKLYFGASYGKSHSKLCELFSMTEFIHFDKIKPLIPSDVSIEDVVDLLSNVYLIKETPTLVQNAIVGDINANCKNDISEKLAEKDQYYTSNYQVNTITTNHIDNLESALNAVQTEEDTICILEWLNNFHKEHLDSNPLITVNSVPWDARRATSMQNITYNYDRFLLYDTPWLAVGNKKYAPREMLLTTVSDEIKSIPNNLLQYKNFFSTINVKENIWDMDPDIFYDILLRLPDFDTAGILSKRIYNNLNEESYIRYGNATCPQKKLFLSTGKLFAKNTPTSHGEFRNISEVKFASQKSLNPTKVWLIAKNERTGNAIAFKKIFGIDLFEEQITVTNFVPHSEQSRFAKMWADFVPFLEIYATKNQEIKKHLHDINITIVSYAENNGVALDAPDYFVMQGSKKTEWYIYLSKNNKLNHEIFDVCIGDIINVIAHSKDSVKTEIAILFGKTTDTGRLNVLENLGYDTEDYKNPNIIKEEFLSTLAQSVQDPNSLILDDLDPNDFRNINARDSVKHIINILHANNVSFQDLRANGFTHDIDFNKYHNDMIQQRLKSTELDYQRALYSELLSATPEEQQTYYSKISERNNITVPETDIDCDYDKYCPIPKCSDTDINKIFHDNMNQFKIDNQNFSDDDLENLTYLEMSMVMFAQFDNLKHSLEQKATRTTITKQQQTSTKLDDCLVNTDDSNVHATTPKTNTNHHTNKNHATVSGKKLAQVKLTRGDDAEELVYNYLCVNGEYSSINWVSCAGFRKGFSIVNDDTRGYDMSYVHNNKTYYAEVKSVSGDGGTYDFIVSDKEKRTATEQMETESYVFILVLPHNKIQFINSKEKIKEILDSAEPDYSFKCSVTI